MDLITEHRLARRAAILDTARAMIAERGFEAITVRDLASACRVSVPTLYNQFGGKDQLLAAAIEDHFSADSQQLSRKDNLAGVDRIFRVLDTITDQFLEQPAFHRRMLEAFASLESTTKVQQKISVNLAEEIEHALIEMQASDTLIDWINVSQLAAQVTTAFISATVVWSSAAIAESALPASVRYAVSLVLLGTALGDAKEKLEAHLKAAQKMIETYPISPPKVSDIKVN